MDRERAVWTAAHDTINGKIRPMISRIQTKNAHDPLRAANGATSAGPAPVAIQKANSATWTASDAEQQARHQDEWRLGQLRRHEVPVAEDHRREDAADRSREGMPAGQQEPRRVDPLPHASAPKTSTSSPAAKCNEPRVARDRSAPQHEEVQRAAIRTNAASAARRGTSNAGFATTGESPSVAGSDPSENHASTPNKRAQIVTNRTNPGVAEVRQRASCAIAYAPTARPVSTVQLM